MYHCMISAVLQSTLCARHSGTKNLTGRWEPWRCRTQQQSAAMGNHWEPRLQNQSLAPIEHVKQVSLLSGRDPSLTSVTATVVSMSHHSTGMENVGLMVYVVVRGLGH